MQPQAELFLGLSALSLTLLLIHVAAGHAPVCCMLQAANDFGSAGKADAAWQDAAPDTANSCDSNGSAQQEAA
jgi:hypothetical protein